MMERSNSRVNNIILNNNKTKSTEAIPTPKVEVCFTFGGEDEDNAASGSVDSVAFSEECADRGQQQNGNLRRRTANHAFKKMQRAKSCVVKNKDTHLGVGTSEALGGGPTLGGAEDAFHRAVLAAVTRSNSFHTSRGHSQRSGPGGFFGGAGAGGEDQLSGSSTSNGSGSVRKKFKMKEKTKILLKLHIIQQKALSVEEMLLQLQVLTCECQDAPISNSSSSEENGNGDGSISDVVDEVHEAFISKVLEIEAQVQLLVKLVMLLCRHRFMERHSSFLSTIREQMQTTLDISVAFFGIDWPHILRVARNLVQLVEGLLLAIKEESFISVEDRPVAAAAAVVTAAAAGNLNGSSAFEIDLIIPSNVLRNLATIEADVSSHAEAVLRGRLSRRHQEGIALAQERRRMMYLLSCEEEEEARKKLKSKKKKKKKKKDKHADDIDAVQAAEAALDDEDDDGDDSPLEEESEVLARARASSKEGGGRSLWGAVKGFTFFRKSPSRRNHPNNDDLWRLWYMGLQSMTMSVSILAAQQEHQPQVANGDVPAVTVTDDVAPAATHIPLQTHLGFKHVLDDEVSSTPPPSEQDQLQVLGVYSTEVLLTPKMGSCGEERRANMENMMSKDDTLESLKILEMVEAPRQRVAESEL